MSQVAGWLETIPNDWQRKKLKYVASLKSGDSITSDDIEESGEYPVFGGNGIRGYASEYTHCGHHVLIGRQGALCGNINYATGYFWASEHAVVATINTEADVTWLGELLRSMNLNQYSQSAAQPGLAVDVIANLEIPVPPLSRQRAIANYLDRETARLDALGAAKERVLGLLAEKRRSLITRSVTRGLDPRAPLRDSGIPWLGAIPKHWTLKRGKWLFHERDQRSTTGEEILLSLRMERGLVRHNDVSEKQTRAEDLIGYKKTSIGEIVLNRMRAASGLVAVAPLDGLVSPDYAVFVALSEANAHYFTHLFKTELLQRVFRSESTGLGTGSSGFLRLYSESFLSLWMPCPPIDEQRAILEHITGETAKIDAMTYATKRTLTLLTERRAALISAAVTGRLDVG